MNALAYIQNQQAQDMANAMGAIDVTAPVVDNYRPEAAANVQTTNTRQTAGVAAYHFLFVAVFLFGGIVALGTLTGELDIKEVGTLPKI